MGRIKSLDEIKAMVLERMGKRNVFRRAKREDVESVLANLTSKDPELWAKEWSRAAKPYEEAGAKHEQAGRTKDACEAYVMAYTYYALGRYPVAHTPGKQENYRKSVEMYEKGGALLRPAAGKGSRALPRQHDSCLSARAARRQETFGGDQLRRHRFLQGRELRVR